MRILHQVHAHVTKLENFHNIDTGQSVWIKCDDFIKSQHGKSKY